MKEFSYRGLLKNVSEEQARELLPDGLILLGYRGSIAHNIYTPQSNPDSIDDKDILGVFVGPREHYVGFGRPEVKERFIGEWDAVSYEVRKFIGLLLKCNPNVLSMLWLPDRHMIYCDSAGRQLIENRSIFVTKQAYHSFNGYAYGQFKRMTHFNQEKQAEMARLEEVISSHRIDLDDLNATQEQRAILTQDVNGAGDLGSLIDALKSMRTKYYFGGYMGAKRKELVKRVGYDAKNAAHLIRILRMGIEFLTEGALYVERADSEQLLEIKRGEWSLDRVKTEAERLFRLAEEAYIRSPLPAQPDRSKAEALCMEIVSHFSKGYEYC